MLVIYSMILRGQTTKGGAVKGSAKEIVLSFVLLKAPRTLVLIDDLQAQAKPSAPDKGRGDCPVANEILIFWVCGVVMG